MSLLIVTPPKWVEGISSEDFEKRLNEKVAAKLRRKKYEIAHRFKISVRKGKTIQITVKPTNAESNSSDGGPPLDAEASPEFEAMISRAISEALEELLSEMSHGL